jgi:hypothetical protein
MDVAQQEELVKRIKDALTLERGHLMYDLFKISIVSAEYGRSVNDINIMAMWTVENANQPFTLGNLEEPVWVKELSLPDQEAARLCVQEHVGKAGPHYGLLSEVVAKELSSKYGVEIDAVLNFARYNFCKHTGNTSLLCDVGMSTCTQVVDMQDLSTCFVSPALDEAKATALFREVCRSTSALENVANAFESVYGVNTALWDFEHHNVIAATKMFGINYILKTYKPHDNFNRAMAVLGGSLEWEIREKLVELVQTASGDICDEKKKALKRDIWRTATQQFSRFMENAKQLTRDREAKRREVTNVCG